MQRLEVSGAVRLIYKSLGVKGLKNQLDAQLFFLTFVYSNFLHVSSNQVLIIRSTNSCIYNIWYWLTVVANCRFRGGVETD